MSSTDVNLPFLERARLAKQEQAENLKKKQESQKVKARLILDTVNLFVDDIMNSAKDKYIQAIHSSDPSKKRQTFQLWDFSLPTRGHTNSGHNVRIKAPGETDIDFYTPYILTHGYKRLVESFFPEENKSIQHLLQERFQTEEFNNGVDPFTGHKLNVCIFTKKGPKSIFKNGIVLSRDGVLYDEVHVPDRVKF